jgi:hypothetical protein
VVRVKLYRCALLRRREGEGEQSRGRAQVGGRRRRALRVRGGRLAPAARHGRTKGGKRRRRGWWERQQGDTWGERRAAQVCSRLRKQPAVVDHARGRGRGARGPEEEDEDRFAKTQKCRDPTVML